MKKNSKVIATMALVMSVAASSTAFATSNSGIKERINPTMEQKQNLNKEKKHIFYESSQILTKLRITEQELSEARSNNKSFFDLTKEKGFTEEQVRKIIIQEITTSLNKKVEEGQISKEKADEILNRSKQKVEQWDGTLSSEKKSGKSLHFFKDRNKSE